MKIVTYSFIIKMVFISYSSAEFHVLLLTVQFYGERIVFCCCLDNILTLLLFTINKNKFTLYPKINNLMLESYR